MEQLVLVTGTPRSGISLAGGILHACGAGSGGARGHAGAAGRTRYYQATAFQSQDLHRLTIGPILQGLGADPRGQAPLPDPASVREIATRAAGSLRRTVDDFFETRDPGRKIVFYADPGLALLWPIWHEAYPLAPWLVVRRQVSEIVSACVQTTWMTAYESESEWETWAIQYEDRFREIPNRRDFWVRALLDGDASDARSIVEDLGLTWDSEAVETFLAPVLWRRGTFGLGGHGGRDAL